MATRAVVIGAAASVLAACHKSAPTGPGTASASSLVVTFGANPVPFASTGCNDSIPQGWYTTARIDERGHVTFTPSTLTQKLDGTVSSVLAESFSSRFGACPGMAFAEGVILADGAVCGTVGVCTPNTFSTYQLTIAGMDANGHSLSFDSPVLQLGPRPAGQAAAALPLVVSAPARR